MGILNRKKINQIDRINKLISKINGIKNIMSIIYLGMGDIHKIAHRFNTLPL